MHRFGAWGPPALLPLSPNLSYILIGGATVSFHRDPAHCTAGLLSGRPPEQSLAVPSLCYHGLRSTWLWVCCLHIRAPACQLGRGTCPELLEWLSIQSRLATGRAQGPQKGSRGRSGGRYCLCMCVSLCGGAVRGKAGEWAGTSTTSTDSIARHCQSLGLILSPPFSLPGCSPRTRQHWGCTVQGMQTPKEAELDYSSGSQPF